MALNENQILNLLGDGNISDLSISSIASEDDLDYLLQQFENDGYSGIIENEHLALANADIFNESENYMGKPKSQRAKFGHFPEFDEKKEAT